MVEEVDKLMSLDEATEVVETEEEAEEEFEEESPVELTSLELRIELVLFGPDTAFEDGEASDTNTPVLCCLGMMVDEPDW